jgi:hypothetical protein
MILFALAAAFGLAGCGSFGAFVGDNLPVWAGGLPADVPPRPSDPRYPEYEKTMKERSGGASAQAPVDTPSSAKSN